MDGWSLAHLDELAAIEAGWPEHAAGTSLLHVDLRADNLLLTTAGAVVVDWAWACVGSPLLDAVGFAPSVAMQGGPSPQELLAMTAAGRDAAPESVLALACAVAGYFTEVALTPPDAGLRRCGHSRPRRVGSRVAGSPSCWADRRQLRPGLAARTPRAGAARPR